MHCFDWILTTFLMSLIFGFRKMLTTELLGSVHLLWKKNNFLFYSILFNIEASERYILAKKLKFRVNIGKTSGRSD